ncbi:MAG: tetratricopeptide repeat protein, partial [Magnetococcales bacterium]|nr:tetratricopeptide repeat protein [Magnetococcales bacterium]
MVDVIRKFFWAGFGVILGVIGGGMGAASASPVEDPLETGRALLRSGEFARAASAFARVTDADGKPERRLAVQEGRCEALAYQSLAEKRAELAMLAVESCSESIRLDSSVARSWRLRGVARLAAGQLEQALINFNHALRLSPEDGAALRERGVVLLGLGRLSDAETDFQRAARLDPDRAWNEFNRGWILARQGRVAEAVEAWQGFLRQRGAGGREWLARVARPVSGVDPEVRRVFEALERAEQSQEKAEGRGGATAGQSSVATAAAATAPKAEPAVPVSPAPKAEPAVPVAPAPKA